MSLGAGAGLEVVTLLSLLPKTSTQPPTGFQEILLYTQVPGAAAFSLLFDTGLGDQLDRFYRPFGILLTYIGVFAVFLFQCSIMGLPVWITLQAWARVRGPREPRL